MQTLARPKAGADQAEQGLDSTGTTSYSVLPADVRFLKPCGGLELPDFQRPERQVLSVFR